MSVLPAPASRKCPSEAWAREFTGGGKAVDGCRPDLLLLPFSNGEAVPCRIGGARPGRPTVPAPIPPRTAPSAKNGRLDRGRRCRCPQAVRERCLGFPAPSRASRSGTVTPGTARDPSSLTPCFAREHARLADRAPKLGQLQAVTASPRADGFPSCPRRNNRDRSGLEGRLHARGAAAHDLEGPA